ncbi:cytochrome P450 94A1-like [Silene latifolia]|uniref:cytochrome P450 94A1-like n=1 Tax=Silene latifolia TaxID=37657 RepID=UPI003D774E6D
MLELVRLLLPFLLFILSLPIFHFFYKTSISKNPKSSESKTTTFPKPYPIIGHLIAFAQQKSEETFEWLAGHVVSSPSSTFVVHHPFGGQSIYTGHPATVEHILKTNYPIYSKGPQHKAAFRDVFGDSLITINGEPWKFQRQIASHMFTPKSMQNFIENIVDFELNERLIPILSNAAKNRDVIDLQHVLQRFTFDNICLIAFGHDPGYLSPSMPQAKFYDAFDDAVTIAFSRFIAPFPIIWKIRKFFNIGDEKRIRVAIQEIRNYANKIVEQKKQGIHLSEIEDNDLLQRLLKYEELFDEKLIIDIVTTFIFAGRDPTSAGLTWFFWMLHKNKRVETEIIKEIKKIDYNNNSALQQIKAMTYTHASLSETMRLYPPVPMDSRQVARDDILPDGTPVKKGTIVNYIMYAMGRLESLWGPDWAEFRPERWLTEVVSGGGDVGGGGEREWKFESRDPFTYPVFNAGPRSCLGKEMAYFQMKRIAAGILKRFVVVPTAEEGFEPVFLAGLTSKMQGGFPVRIMERCLDH